MTYGREHLARHILALDDAAVSHLAELVRGELLHFLGSDSEDPTQLQVPSWTVLGLRFA